MAVEKMLLVSVTGTIRRLDNALECCCDSGCFHIQQATDTVSKSAEFISINDANPYTPLCTHLADTFAAARLEPADTVSL